MDAEQHQDSGFAVRREQGQYHRCVCYRAPRVAPAGRHCAGEDVRFLHIGILAPNGANKSKIIDAGIIEPLADLTTFYATICVMICALIRRSEGPRVTKLAVAPGALGRPASHKFLYEAVTRLFR